MSLSSMQGQFLKKIKNTHIKEVRLKFFFRASAVDHAPASPIRFSHRLKKIASTR